MASISELIEENGYTITQLEDLPHHSLMRSMQDRLINLSYYNLHDWSIYRVPSRLRELNKDAYTPRIVSIGPFHSGQQNLQDMEVHKTRYMQSLFNRTTNPSLTFSECCKAIQNTEETARDCYSEYDQNIQNQFGSLAEILLVDGCFILELFLRFTSSGNSTEKIGDPIFIVATIGSLRRDLALLENQIPFFVLQRLFDCLMRADQRRTPAPLSLNKLCASFFDLELNSSQSSSDCRHLLGLIRECYLSRHSKSDEAYNLPCELSVAIYCCVWSKSRTKQKPNKSLELIHCVTKLRDYGIKFVKGTSGSLCDIKFSPGGVLEIPELCIDDTMDSLLRNMIAFEQCCNGIGHQITSYAILMECLMDSPGDAEYLQHKKITTYLGRGEDNIFNKISNKVFVEHFYFDALCKQANEYCNRWWPQKRESFVRNYWKFIGLGAGSILVLLAVLQTGYTMASFHYPPK